jgi:AcrR family transcriptional regulator
VLYDALVEATQQLLASEGLEGVTTNRVAERAGVSIGSLYQYFPSREALIAAVIDRKLEQDLVELTPLVQSLHHVDLDAALAGLVEVAVRYYRDETPLYRAMVAALTEVDRDALVHRALAGFDGAIVAVLAPHAAELVPRYERCAWIIRETLIACVRAAAAEHPNALADGSLARQLEAMLRALVVEPEN